MGGEIYQTYKKNIFLISELNCKDKNLKIDKILYFLLLFGKTIIWNSIIGGYNYNVTPCITFT